MPASTSSFRVSPQAVIGLLIVVVGVLLTLDNLHWLEAGRILRYWPLGIVAAGAVKFAQSTLWPGKVFGLVVMAFGAVWTANTVFGLPVDVGDFWPVLLVLLGIRLVSRARRPSSDLAGAADASAAGEGTITEFAVWAGKQRRSTSASFRRADITAIMGGVELDLRGASTATGEAVIDVFAMWGGIEIWVPPDWAVSNQVGLLMGGAEDKSTGAQDARHRLIVRGFVIMGGLEIKT